MANSQPNVLLLMSDQHNYRSLSHIDASNGGEPVSTPTISNIAQTGANFEQTYCQSPLCGPSRISMLTGREVQYSGGINNSSILNPDCPTFPEIFSENGYDTCLVGKMHLGGNRQFVGFDHRPYGDLTGEAGHQHEPVYNDDPDWECLNLLKGMAKGTSELTYSSRWRHANITNAGQTEFPESALQEQNVVSETLAFLREQQSHNPDVPWLMCASFSRPHPPYTAPKRHLDRYWPDGVTNPTVEENDSHPLSNAIGEWFKMDKLENGELLKARASYFACVDYLDEILGDLLGSLDRSGFLDNTIVIYLSDHGDMVGEHNLWGKRTWHEESSRVPFMIQLPEHRTGNMDSANISTPVSLADLFPTLCGLADIEQPDELDGEDLSESIMSGEEPDRDPVFVDFLTGRFGEELNYRAIRAGKYKYIGFKDARDRLFDISNDPFEENDLLENQDEVDSEVINEFQSILKESIDFETVGSDENMDDVGEEYDLKIPTGHANVYHMPDDRLIDADRLIYQSHVLADNPEDVFDNYNNTDL